MRRTLVVISVATFVSLNGAHAGAETVVTLSFDDTLADQVQAGAMLIDYGMRGTFFVNSSRIDRPSYMSSADLDSLYAAGHEIGGHTINHYRLATQSHDEVQRQICDDRVALLARGYAVTSFAYPKSSQNDDVRAVAAACGYNAARNASGLHSQGFQICASCPQAETIPPRDPFLILTPISLKSQHTLADLQQTVTVVEAQGGGWLPFVIHHVCDGCNSDSVSPAILRDFIAWLAARSSMGTTVKTIHDVMGGPTQPGVSAPVAVPYVGADGNLLRNPSFEDDLFASDLGPDCWRIGAGPIASLIDASVSPMSHTGSDAARIDVQPGAPGKTSIYSLQDTGQCAPPSQPGDVFRVSGWYQSTDTVELAAFYRLASGWWVFWAAGPPLAAAPSYALAEWTTPPAPAEATGVAVGINLTGAGSVLFDDVSLVRIASVAGPDGGAAVPDGGTSAADLGVGPTSHDPLDLSTGPQPTDGGGCSMGRGGRVEALAILSVAVLAVLLRRRRSDVRRAG